MFEFLVTFLVVDLLFLGSLLLLKLIKFIIDYNDRK